LGYIEGKLITYFWWGIHHINDELIIEILEYAISPTLTAPLITEIENGILSKASEICQIQNAKKLHIKLFEPYGIIQNILTRGARDICPYWDGFMVAILNLKQFLRKLQTYLMWLYKKRNINSKNIKNSIKKINLKVENFLICFEIKDSIYVKIIELQNLDDLKTNEIIIDLPRRYLGILIFGNMQPNELVESNVWKCDEKYIEILDELFPKMYGVVYPLDGF
jgi:hypothetical protein